MSRRIAIVGAGFYGSVLTDAGHRVTVFEQRDHIGGNCFTRYHEAADCHQHVYGAHIFHTSHKPTWDFVNRFAEFNHYVNRVKVSYQDTLYSFPINLMTLQQLYGVRTPAEAEAKLAQVREPMGDPQNMEQWCLAHVGRELYETFIKGYSTKQWKRPPSELPASIIKRIPIRLTYDDNYFTDRFQGIPIGGYTALFERLLEGIAVELGVDFLADRDQLMASADHTIFTGPIDAFFKRCHGSLDYRSLRFESQLIGQRDFQGNAVVNYTDAEVPHTRILEHKHFDLSLKADQSLITHEYPEDWQPGKTEYYPVNTPEASERYKKYCQQAHELQLPVTFGGRLGAFRYYDMHQVVAAAITQSQQLIERFRSA